MTARTFDELFDRQPTITLTLVRTPSGWSSVIDQHGKLYFPPTRNIETCLRFMSAMARKGDALVDDASVERATWHSVRVTALEERADVGTTVAAPSRSSNVVPFRRPLEPLDEETCA